MSFLVYQSNTEKVDIRVYLEESREARKKEIKKDGSTYTFLLEKKKYDII
jgi:hypothetical protein